MPDLGHIALSFLIIVAMIRLAPKLLQNLAHRYECGIGDALRAIPRAIRRRRNRVV